MLLTSYDVTLYIKSHLLLKMSFVKNRKNILISEYRKRNPCLICRYIKWKHCFLNTLEDKIKISAIILLKPNSIFLIRHSFKWNCRWYLQCYSNIYADIINLRNKCKRYSMVVHVLLHLWEEEFRIMSQRSFKSWLICFLSLYSYFLGIE